MPRQSVIRIRAEITIPYDRKKMGSAATAEKHCDVIHAELGKTLAGRRWRIPAVRTGLLGQGKGHLRSFLEREEVLKRKGVKHG